MKIKSVIVLPTSMRSQSILQINTDTDGGVPLLSAQIHTDLAKYIKRLIDKDLEVKRAEQTLPNSSISVRIEDEVQAAYAAYVKAAAEAKAYADAYTSYVDDKAAAYAAYVKAAEAYNAVYDAYDKDTIENPPKP